MSIPGLDLLFLGHPKWPHKEILKAFPKGFALQFFGGVVSGIDFSKLALERAKDYVRSGKLAALSTHFWYSPKHDLCPMALIEKLAPAYEKMAINNPMLPIYISHTCEYQGATRQQLVERRALLYKLAPHCIPVETRWTGATTGVIQQTHDTKKPLKPPYQASTDGVCVYEKFDAKAYNDVHALAAIRYYWSADMNGKGDSEDKTPIPKRECFPTANTIKAVAALASDYGTPPKPLFKGKIVPFCGKNIYKNFSERNTDKRSLKPCVICPSKAAFLYVVDYKGTTIAKFNYYGAYSGGGNRFYSGTGTNLWNYELANRAKKISGSPFVWFQDGSTFYGPANPIFRCDSNTSK